MTGRNRLGKGIIVFDVPEISSEYGISLCEICKGILQEIRQSGLASTHPVSSTENNLPAGRMMRSLHDKR